MRGRSCIIAVTAGLLLVSASGCTGSAVALSSATGATAASSTGTPTGSAAAAIPTDDQKLIRAAIDAVNAAAGKEPVIQRAVFQRLVAPDLADQQRSCKPAGTTVRFEPAWTDLRVDPDGAAHSYVLPALIRVFTGDRITGADVTALIVSVSGGRAHLPPLCVS